MQQLVQIQTRAPGCALCGAKLDGRQERFCSRAHRRTFSDRHRPKTKWCADCETPIVGRADRCQMHAALHRVDLARELGETFGFLKEVSVERNPFCPNEELAACETSAPHVHCECGWPIRPGAFACHICIAEQPRLEFKSVFGFKEVA